MKRIGIDLAGERFRGFAEFRMNSAKSFFVKKDACPVALMGKSIPFLPGGAGIGDKQRSLRRNSVGFRPMLAENSPAFLVGYLDGVLPTTAAAIVTAPILNCRQFETKPGHLQSESR